MAAAPPGEIVKIYVDAYRPLEVGDYIRTSTGRTYEVVSKRVQKRGLRKGRQHLTVQVLAKDAVLDPDCFVLELHWYSRKKRI